MSIDNANRRFCSSCGAPLTDTPFCGQCGTKVPVMAVEISASVTETAPVVELIPDPQPVVQIGARPWRFPVASVILMAIATLWFIIRLCTATDITPFGVLYMCCTVAVLVGMIICKKKRNLIVGLSFLAYACATLAYMITDINILIQQGADIVSVVILQIFNAVNLLCYVAFGVSYLVAKHKIFVLKIVAGATTICFALFGCLCMVIAAVTTYDLSMDVASHLAPYIWAFLGFLLNTIPVGIGVILYTPFKKR